MSRIFLTTVGCLYLLLAAWCVARPEQTARSVGFERRAGAGESEYLTVYGGLQVGLALVFLLPWWRPEALPFSLLACLVVHGALVAFRTIGFISFQNMPPTTWGLAAAEWAVFLGALALWARSQRN